MSVASAVEVPVSRSRETVIGVACGLATALIWAGWSVATRFAVTTHLGPQDVTFLRFGVSALLLWPVLLRHGLGFRRIGWQRLLIMVTGAGVPFALLTSIGTRFAPASHVATLMIGAMPVFVALLSKLFLGERFGRMQKIGLCLVVGGIACIGGYALAMNRGGGEWRGDLLFLLCGLLFASYSVAQRHSGMASWHAMAWVNVCSCLLYAPIYLLCLHPRILAAPPAEVLLQAGAQGIGVAILGLYLYAEAGRRLGASRAAIFGALAPAFSVPIGIAALGEFPGWLTLTGIVLVMVGVVWVVAGKKRNQARGLSRALLP